jgi:hypothetical protein
VNEFVNGGFSEGVECFQRALRLGDTVRRTNPPPWNEIGHSTTKTAIHHHHHHHTQSPQQ